MHHRIYHLNYGVSLLGLRPQDMMVLLVSVVIGLNVLGALFPGRLRLAFAAVFVFGVFRLWQALRDRTPNKFFVHLFRWLSEPEVYRVRPDVTAIPLIVAPTWGTPPLVATRAAPRVRHRPRAGRPGQEVRVARSA